MNVMKRNFIARAAAAAGAIGLTLTAGAALAQDKIYTMKITLPTLNDPSYFFAKNYAAALEKDSGGRIKPEIYPASQLGMTVDGKFAGSPGDFRAQATQCFENLKHALAAVGATFEHVVRVTNYFVDMAHLPIYFEVRDRYVDTKAPPASTAIQISKLARDGALFEIEAIAVVPQR